MFNCYYHNLLVFLYLLQAGTYGAAAVVAGRGNHNALCLCYLASAVLQVLRGACHLIPFD